MTAILRNNNADLSRNKKAEQIDKEFFKNSNEVAEYNHAIAIRASWSGPDVSLKRNTGRIYIYCGLDNSQLIKKQPVESDLNPGIFFQVYQCNVCGEKYKGLSKDTLQLVRDPSVKAIVEHWS